VPPPQQDGCIARVFAFTLAEVLITLGIIGVVAAVTMPTLIANHKKKVVATRLKQTYSQLSQAIEMAELTYGDHSMWPESNITGTVLDTDISDTRYVQIFADKYILPYLKTTSAPEKTALKNKGYKNGIRFNHGGQYVSEHYMYYFAELANGVTLLFTNTGNGKTKVISAFVIWIDIDGSAGENKIGHDIFPIHFTSQRGIYVYGLEQSENVLINSCKNMNNNDAGISCIALIILNGWEITSNYPW